MLLPILFKLFHTQRILICFIFFLKFNLSQKHTNSAFEELLRVFLNENGIKHVSIACAEDKEKTSVISDLEKEASHTTA